MNEINRDNFFIKAGSIIYRTLNLNSKNYAMQDMPRVGNLLSAEEMNNHVADLIRKRQPYMISRLGAIESNAVLNYLQLKTVKESKGIGKIHRLLQGNLNFWKPQVKENLQNNAGVFPASDLMVWRFSEFFVEQMKRIDAIGVWGFVPGENYLIGEYCPNALQFEPEALEPYFFSNPWSAALKGKKVLVVHPFMQSIINQYERREKLFPGTDILPEFELKTIKAVQSIAGNKTSHKDWFEALRWMFEQIDSIDFDIALIGAGSYGLPLSAYVKDKGKMSIHIGGATQILFGIKGKRWDNHPVIAKLYNSYWVRPSESEVVPDADKVEDGCYW